MSSARRPQAPEPPPSRLSELQRRQATRLLAPFCAVPPSVRDRLRIGVRFEGSAVVLFESRPRFLAPHEWGEHGVAKFRYVKARQRWQLFCLRRDLKWHVYAPLPEAASLAPLVDEVRSDPTGIFWG